MDADELKARAALLLALAGAALLGYFWLSAVPGTAAEVAANAPLVRRGTAPDWRNPFMARNQGRSSLRPPPPPLPAADGELPAGCAGAVLAAAVATGIFALGRQPVPCLVALPGFLVGPPAAERVVRTLTGYPAGNSPGLWCGLAVVLGLVAGPAAVAGMVAEFRRWLATLWGQ